MCRFKLLYFSIFMLWVSIFINIYYQNKNFNLITENLILIRERQELQSQLNKEQAKFNEIIGNLIYKGKL